MAEKRRGIIIVVMVLALIAFVGFSMGPLLGSILSNQQAKQQPKATPTEASNAAREADLQSQARGYELVLQREPENETALRGLLQAKLQLIQLGKANIKEVISPLTQLAKLHPESVEYSVLLAQAKQYTGDLEGAAQTYRAVLENKPGQIQALQGLVNLQLQQERPEAAIGLLQDTLKAAPQVNQAQPGSIDETSVQLILGQVYAEQKRYEEAIAIYDEAIKTDEQDFRPLLAKALVLKQQGNTEEAEPLFLKASDLAPANFKDQIRASAGTTLTPEKADTPEGTSASPAPPSTALPAPNTAEPTEEAESPQ